jgi:hypothetical protein
LEVGERRRRGVVGGSAAIAPAAGGEVGVDLGSGGKGDLAGGEWGSQLGRGRCFGFVLETINW